MTFITKHTGREENRQVFTLNFYVQQAGVYIKRLCTTDKSLCNFLYLKEFALDRVKFVIVTVSHESNASSITPTIQIIKQDFNPQICRVFLIKCFDLML